MIEENQLLLWNYRFMDERQLEKNYLQTLILYELSNCFSGTLIFKGGTALSMFYGLNRFSEDLDFTYIGEINRTTTISSLDKALNRINALYELGKIKRRGTKTSLDIELHIKGPLYGKRKIEQALELNLSMRETLLIKYDTLELSSIYPDIPMFIVPVMNPKEILAEKVRALLTRKNVKARDVYDIYYLIKHKQIPIDKELINKKLELYGLKFSSRKLLEKLKSIDNNLWLSEMSNLVKDVPNYTILMNFIKTTL